MTSRGVARVGAGLVVVAVSVGAAVSWQPAAPATAQDQSDTTAVLEPIDRNSGPPQDPALVAARVQPLATQAKKIGKTAGTLIADAATGDTLYDDESQQPLIPASTNKLPTAVAALQFAGADRRLRTTTSIQGQELFLIGGGDPLLTTRRERPEPGYPIYPRNTPVADLVKQTVAALKERQLGRVDLRVDDTFFSGPAWGPEWPDYYRTENIVAPVSALIFNDGREGGEWGPISADPAMTAGSLFAQLLRDKGIKVSTDITRAQSPESAVELGRVESVPVYELVEQSLTTSDNQTAENLFRLAGRYADFGASFEGGGKAVTKALEQLGISPVLSSFVDGSGLSRLNQLTPKLLVDIVRLSVTEADSLWPIASGLSVAGVNGTLRGRFAAADTTGAAGWLRGKTGTLNYVSSLAGFVQSRSGRLLVFAAIGNDATSSFEAGAQIDTIMAAVADCGCPGDER